jgi:hypothetical protein
LDAAWKQSHAGAASICRGRKRIGASFFRFPRRAPAAPGRGCIVDYAAVGNGLLCWRRQLKKPRQKGDERIVSAVRPDCGKNPPILE